MRTRIAGGLFVSHLRSETDLKSHNNRGSIISVVGKTTVEIIELFKCTQKVP